MQPVRILAIVMKNILELTMIKKVAEYKFEKELNEFWPDMEFDKPNEFDN